MGDSHSTAATNYDVAKDVDNPTTLFIVFAFVLGLALANVGLSMLGLGKYGLPIQAGDWMRAGRIGRLLLHAPAPG